MGPQHSTNEKLDAILEIMPNAGRLSLSESASRLRRKTTRDATHLLIIGFDYDRNRTAFFRSSSVGDRKGLGIGETSDIRLAGAIHGSR